jgi:hypothetical protein
MNQNHINAFPESRMRGNPHVRFGGRRQGNHQPKGRQGASPPTLLWMYSNDHAPPHFHARYGEYEAQIVIDTGDPLAGQLPARALRFIREWTGLHRAELQANWERAQARTPVARIEPLP